MEANTTHTHALAGGRVNGSRGLRGRLTALVSSRRGGLAFNGQGADQASARIDHYLRDSNAVVLHHRHLPGVRRDISHLVVGPAGVTVVDSRHYKASTRARSELAKSVLAQVDAVRELLVDTRYAKVPIEAAVARNRVEGPRVLQGLNTPRIIVSGTRTIAKEARRGGPMDVGRVRALAAYLNNALD